MIPPTRKAATTAISGNISSLNALFISIAEEKRRRGAGELDFVPMLPRSASPLPLSSPASQLRLSWLDTRHQASDFFLADGFRIYLADNPAFVQHDYPIAQAQHFIQISGDKQNRRARVSKLDKTTVDNLRRPDVHAARWLRDKNQLWFYVELASHDQLLLVAARQRPRRKGNVGWSHVVLVHKPL